MKQYLSLSSVAVFTAGALLSYGVGRLVTHPGGRQAARDKPALAAKSSKRPPKGRETGAAAGDDRASAAAALPVATTEVPSSFLAQRQAPLPASSSSDTAIPVAKTVKPSRSTNVRLKNAYRARIFWTEQSLAKKDLGFDLVVDTAQTVPAAAAQERPYVRLAAAAKGVPPGSTKTLWGTPKAGLQVFLFPLASWPVDTTGLFPQLTVSVAAGSGPADSAAPSKPTDQLDLTLRSLAGGASKGVRVLFSGATRPTPQTGEWFSSWRELTPATAKHIIYLPHGAAMAKLMPMLRAATDFAVEPATAPTAEALHWLRSDTVVASVTGVIDDATRDHLTKLFNADLVYRGSATAWIAPTSETSARIVERLGKLSATGRDVYIYNPAGAKAFVPVRRSFLVKSDAALTMVKQNGLALFTQPVEIVAKRAGFWPAH